MMLRRLTTQRHDYNIKLTTEELLAIGNTSLGNDLDGEGWKKFNDLLDLIEREVKRLGEQQGE